MDVIEITRLIFGETGTLTLALIGVSFALVGYLCSHITSRLYRALFWLEWLSFTGVVISVDHNNSPGFGACIFASSLFLSFIFNCYDRTNARLNAVISDLDLISIDRNPVEALSLLKTIDRDELIGKQAERYVRYLITTEISLGNNRTAREMLLDKENAKLLGSAFAHLMLHVISDRNADYAESQRQLNIALAHKGDKDTDFLTVLQLEHNQAVLDVIAGNVRHADYAFGALRNKVQTSNIQNRDFINSLYENAALNKARLGLPDGGKTAGLEIIKEYEDYLDLNHIEEAMALFNLRLLFLREVKASKEEKEQLYLEFYERVRRGGMSVHQRAIDAVSMLRISWADRICIEASIENVRKNLDVLLHLSPIERYQSLSAVRTVFAFIDLSKVDVEDIIDFAEHYFKTQAHKDIETSLVELPEEARSLRAYFLREEAALKQVSGSTAEASSLMEEAIALLDRSMLKMDAVEYRLVYAKSLLQLDPVKSLLIVDKVLVLVKTLEKQPSLGFVYSQLAFCYALLDKRNECMNALGSANASHSSMFHYAPPIRNEYFIALLVMRFRLFIESINRVKTRADDHRVADKGAVEWCEAFPAVRMDFACVVLGLYLGFTSGVPLSGFGGFTGSGYFCLQHCWLYFPDINLTLDPLVRMKGSEDIGFVGVGDCHPLLAASAYLHLGAAGNLLGSRLYRIGKLDMFCEQDRQLATELVNMLCSVSAGESPTKNDIEAAFLESA